MDKSKHSDHKLVINDAENIKDSLENVCLYLNEIERIINIDTKDLPTQERQYKLQQLEQYLSDMDDLFISIDIDLPRNSNTIC